MKRITTLLTAATALAAAPAFAAMTWDTNDDGAVDAREFTDGQVAASTFERFDDDNDGALTPEEVGLDAPDRHFMQADVDGDGALSEQELGVGTFDFYDTDDDRAISEDEMAEYRADEREGESIFENDAPRGMDDTLK